MDEKVMGMVLSVSHMDEYDKRVVILTKECGKISAFAKGARRPNSPLLACTEPFTFAEFTLFRGRNSYTIKSANVINYFTELREDLEDVYMGMYFLEMASYYTRENIEAAEVLKLVYQSLRALRVTSLHRDLVRSVFELKMITINGEGPNIFSCHECGARENLHYFVSKEECAFCDSCGPVIKRGIKISQTLLYTMQFVMSQPVEKLYTFTLSDEARREFQKIMAVYIQDHIEATFHSLLLLS